MQQLLADPVESEEALLSQPLKKRVGKMGELQERLDSH